MVRENSLVSANIAWESQNSPSDCLVTWEVSGGGLIGNLLTQSSNVELSLWPDTKYRVQVTCKNKVSYTIFDHGKGWVFFEIEKKAFKQPRILS